MIRFFASLFSNLSLAGLVVFGAFAALVRIYSADLPSTAELRDYQPRMLSRVYEGSGQLIAEYARERRVFVPIDEVPDVVKQAFISAEDKNFYTHSGVDPLGIAKAVVRFGKGRLTGNRERLSGASTITQQVVKNFLVGDDRSVERKIKEAILAIRVEQIFTKDEILELYLNDPFMGARSHGLAAAAENYFDKTVEELEVQEAAYLAALLKAPSTYHPIRNRDRAIGRRNYVLERMAANGYIPRVDAERYKAMPLETAINEGRVALVQRTKPNYFTEEVRRQAIREVGITKLYRAGLTVTATIDDELQAMAASALRRGLEKYDRGRGIYRGPITTIPEIARGETGLWPELLPRADAPRDIAGWRLAVVLEVGEKTAIVGVEGLENGENDDGQPIRLRLSRERQWIKRTPQRRGAPRNGADIWERGDVVHVKRENEGWSMRQIPGVQGAFMAMDPHSGRVLALQGGFSYDHSAFNRATQAQRQPGSSFKPFVYAAALDMGYKTSTIVLDEPIVVGSGRRAWKPKNSSGRFSGPLPLRRGLELSKNLMTVRIAQAVGMDRVGQYAERFGVYEDMPDKLSYALGAGETTLWQMVAAYGMFANGGKRVQPTVIDRIQDRHGETLFRHDPRFCRGCDSPRFGKDRTPVLFDQRSQIMDPVTAYNLVDMMRGVISRGTAKKTVGGLGFQVAGKTGTTNDSKDAWFVGFTKNMVAGCFIGFDTPTPMGRGAYGGTLCGPVFKEFMRNAMKTRAPGKFTKPKGGGIVTLKFHAETGERLPDDAEGDFVIVETFDLGEDPEIQVAASEVKRLRSDKKLFTGSKARDLIASLPEGDDAPLPSATRTKGRKGSTKKRRPAAGQGVSGGIGLGTGGVY